jgi:hypothetical protein
VLLTIGDVSGGVKVEILADATAFPLSSPYLHLETTYLPILLYKIPLVQLRDHTQTPDMRFDTCTLALLTR